MTEVSGEEGVVMVSGCHGDCECGGDGGEWVGTPVDVAHLACGDHCAHFETAAAVVFCLT